MIKSSLKYLPEFDVYLVDAYGPFVGKNGVLKSAIAVMAELVAKGKQVHVLSNTASLSAAAMNSYAKKGLVQGVHYNTIFTSGQFAYEAIQAQKLPVKGYKLYCFCTANFKKSENLPAIFNNSVYSVVDTIEDADFAYCGIPQINGEDRLGVDEFLPELQRIKKAGLTLVCANPDLRVNEGGQFVVRQGTIAQIYEEMGGNVVRYGKPDVGVFERVLQDYKGSREKVLMIGDTLGTDILGANRAGIKSCLVLDGGVTEYTLQQQGRSVSEESVKDLILSQEARPDFICRRMSENNDCLKSVA